MLLLPVSTPQAFLQLLHFVLVVLSGWSKYRYFVWIFLSGYHHFQLLYCPFDLWFLIEFAYRLYPFLGCCWFPNVVRRVSRRMVSFFVFKNCVCIFFYWRVSSSICFICWGYLCLFVHLYGIWVYTISGYLFLFLRWWLLYFYHYHIVLLFH